MSKRLILILALAFVVGVAFTAYAEVQNVKVSGDLSVSGVSRRNIQLRKHDLDPIRTTQHLQYGKQISAVLSQVRLRIDADLTDNVSTTVRLLNERIWGEETNTADDTDIDLDLAYVSLKEFLYSPLSLTVGRQELMFGNGLIIGDVDTNGIMAGHGTAVGTAGLILPKSLDDLTVRKAFDAIRATLNYDPLVVDAVYAKVDENAIDVKEDLDLYGVNANYALDKNTTLEGYYWEKRRQKATGTGGTAALGTGQQSLNDVTRTLGTRVQYTGLKNLLLSLEGAYQFGKYIKNTSLYPDEAVNDRGARRRSAYALQVISQYNLSDLIKNYEPVIRTSYTLLSGDPYKSRSSRYHGWDSMYENQAGGTLFNKILGYSNAQLINVNTSLKPMEDVKFSLDYYHLRFIKPYRYAQNDGLADAVNLTGVAGDPVYKMVYGEKEIGNEIDATLTYDYTEDVQFALTAGWFIPGDAFANENDTMANQVIGSMKVTF